MTTFKQFLAEDQSDQEIYAVKIAAEVFLKNCDDWKDVRKPLWRLATSYQPMRLRSTRERSSKSKAGTAEIQEWIFSQPGWERFPKRRNSIFCSTNKEFKIGGGEVDPNKLYAIYPVNGTVMALTKAVDFNYIEPFKADPLYGKDFAFVRFLINDYAHLATIDDSLPLQEKWKQVQRFYKKTERWRNERDKATFQALEDELPEAFTPERMGCILVKSSAELPLGKQREVWFEGKYLSIPQSSFDEFCNAVEMLRKP